MKLAKLLKLVNIITILQSNDGRYFEYLLLAQNSFEFFMKLENAQKIDLIEDKKYDSPLYVNKAKIILNEIQNKTLKISSECYKFLENHCRLNGLINVEEDDDIEENNTQNTKFTRHTFKYNGHEHKFIFYHVLCDKTNQRK